MEKEVDEAQDIPELMDEDQAAVADGSWPGILTFLDDYGPDTILTESKLAEELGRHQRSNAPSNAENSLPRCAS
jgi:hypothetical protein